MIVRLIPKWHIGSIVRSNFLTPHSHPSGFYWDNQSSRTLTSANNLQMSNIQYKVAFTLGHFTQYASSFHNISNIFAYLKHNNFLHKADQCEHGLITITGSKQAYLGR